MSDKIQDIRMKTIIGNQMQMQHLTPKQPSKIGGQNFDEVLHARMQANSTIEFSKHAMHRVQERNIEMSVDTWQRLQNGVSIAQHKGLKAPLILVDNTAFVVNVDHNKIITTMKEESLRGTVITNIDGTVII